MSQTENILFLIYAVSIVLTMSGYARNAKTSDAYKMLGGGNYYFNALFVSFIPLVNTLLSVGFIFELIYTVVGIFKRK